MADCVGRSQPAVQADMHPMHREPMCLGGSVAPAASPNFLCPGKGGEDVRVCRETDPMLGEGQEGGRELSS